MRAVVFAVIAGQCWGVGEIFTKSALNSRQIGPMAILLVRRLGHAAPGAPGLRRRGVHEQVRDWRMVARAGRIGLAQADRRLRPDGRLRGRELLLRRALAARRRYLAAPVYRLLPRPGPRRVARVAGAGRGDEPSQGRGCDPD